VLKLECTGVRDTDEAKPQRARDPNAKPQRAPHVLKLERTIVREIQLK
jgi:hypothetical protein